MREDPRRSIDNLRLYLLGDSSLGVRGLIPRTERRLGAVPRAQHRIELKALCAHTRAQLEDNIFDVDILLGTIERILHHQGTWCPHQLRPVKYTGWDGEGNRVSGVRRCDHCQLTVTSPIPQDAICIVCGGAAFRSEGKGNEGPALKTCGAACASVLSRSKHPPTEADLAERRRKRNEKKHGRRTVETVKRGLYEFPVATDG